MKGWLLVLSIFTIFFANTSLKADDCTVNFKDLITVNEMKVLKTIEKEYCSGIDLYSQNTTNVKINLELLHLGLNLNDFEMTEVIDRTNIRDGILTVYFWQKNNEYNGMSLTLFTSYDIKSDKLMMIVTDGDYKFVKFLGDKSKVLLEHLIKYDHFPLELTFQPEVQKNLDFFFNN